MNLLGNFTFSNILALGILIGMLIACVKNWINYIYLIPLVFIIWFCFPKENKDLIGYISLLSFGILLGFSIMNFMIVKINNERERYRKQY